MIIRESSGAKEILVSIYNGDKTNQPIEEFDAWLDNTSYRDCTGYSLYITVNAILMVITCDVSMGLEEIIEYWKSKGHKLWGEKSE